MLKLYDKTFSSLLGTLNTVTEALVEEERNGLFELSFIILNTDSLFKYIEKENIVVCNANDTLLNQKFRIYNIRKLMNNRVQVLARHISFDLMYDYIDNVSFENQSCEYALNQLFRNSNFSTNYRGYSDIVNTQNYSISDVNVLSAIAGTEGSIIDTYGSGPDILRDNENIHVLTRRGNDNLVTIEYRKNLTGFELEEDTTDLVTRIIPYAKYTPEGEDEVTIKASFVDSPYINNYSHPYIKLIDYSDKFEDKVVPTIDKLIRFAELEYQNNKVDIPKQNYKITFIPLSKTVGYEALNDKISLCDTVTIKDTRYNINTQSKVIRTVFDVLKNRYESIELGEPKTTLGDIIGNSNNNEVIVGPQGPQGEAGKDGNLGDFPNSLPQTPMLKSFVYGFANIELTWTFENKVYYSYELYGSKTKDFTPNTFDLIFQGQASSYLFQAKPNETWYFKICAINTYGERTTFSNQATVVTTKISDLANYVDNMAIGEALIGTLSLDRGWIGKLNANLLNVKGNFSVTDGNGKRTLDIDSFGNINLDVTELKIQSNTVAQEKWVNSQIKNTSDSINARIEKTEKTGVTNIIPYSYFQNTDIIKKYWYLTEGVNWHELGGWIGLQNPTTSDRNIVSQLGAVNSRVVSLYTDLTVEANAGAKVYIIGSINKDFRYDWTMECINYQHSESGGKKLEGIVIPNNINYLFIHLTNIGGGNFTNNVVWLHKINLVDGYIANEGELVDIQQISQLFIDTNGIRTEVSKKVDNDKVVSTINQSAEQIKIQANKLDLNGYVTVNSLSEPGATIIDGRNIKTGFIEAIQLIAPHITGKTQMYLEPGSIFSSDGSANFKTIYIMPGGSMDSEGAIRSKKEIISNSYMQAIQFLNPAGYPMIYTKALGYKWMVEAITLSETESNGQIVDYAEFQTNLGHRYGVGIWYAGNESTLSNTYTDDLIGIDLINSLEYIPNTLNSDNTSLSYQNIPKQFCFNIEQENGSTISHVSPKLMLPHVTLSIQQQQEQINLLKEQIELLREEIKIIKEGV